jgi:hypothetical protein
VADADVDNDVEADDDVDAEPDADTAKQHSAVFNAQMGLEHLPTKVFRAKPPKQSPATQLAFCVQQSVVSCTHVMPAHDWTLTLAGSDDQPVAGQSLA